MLDALKDKPDKTGHIRIHGIAAARDYARRCKEHKAGWIEEMVRRHAQSVRIR
ncbi:MAG TPA: hypothetical protein VMY42_14730 [Thermoguttaceae bacterium]|nr:hypothetical protein [Thermoguttaceae bacterium]